MTEWRGIFELPDGSINTVTPAPKSRLAVFVNAGGGRYTARLDEKGPGRFLEFAESEEEWFQRIIDLTVRGSAELQRAKRIPDCRRPDFPLLKYQSCWRNDGSGKIGVDMALARAKRMAEIRSERDGDHAEPGRFKAFDNEWMKAMGRRDTARADAIEAARQRLREIPNQLTADGTLEGIATLEELEAFEPEWPEMQG